VCDLLGNVLFSTLILGSVFSDSVVITLNVALPEFHQLLFDFK